MWMIWLMLACSTPTPSDAPPVAHVTAATADTALAAKPLILDVRTPGEFAGGHLEGAVNVDYNGADFAGEVAKLDLSGPVLVYCASGGRSTASLATLQKAGATQLTHLDGGFRGWVAAGKPTTK